MLTLTWTKQFLSHSKQLSSMDYKKYSLRHKEKKFSEKHIENLRKSHLGYVMPEEQKRKKHKDIVAVEEVTHTPSIMVMDAL